MTRGPAVDRLPPCDDCGKPMFACYPGSIEQTTGDDGRVVLLHPIPAVPAHVWCRACWPWNATNRQVARS